MGKKNFRGKRKGGAGGGRGGGESGRGDGWRSYPTIKKENSQLEEFYNALIQLPEEEKAQFWEALRRELPNSFRFCGSKGHALAVKKLLQTRYIPDIVKIEFQDGTPVEPPKPVSWYPEELAWWMTTPKNIVRKFPPFAAFQKFLVSETTVGNISRQEVVSMIPPLVMDVRPGHVVLDMCAAPGSKAAQLLEMIHVGEEGRVRKVLRQNAQEDGLDLGDETKEEAEVDIQADPSDSGRATGLLIANDADYKRGHMLVHQLKRLSSPNLIVTNHDASQFPSIRLPSDDPRKGKYLKFDRILADVPCSGDGTLRKNIGLWANWVPGSALGLHITQVRILVRALQLLKVGGRVVYSTCSMNPVENESVVGAAIDRCGGKDNVEILDSTDYLPNLKRAPGMTEWKIMDKSGRMWNTWAEVQKFADEENNGVIPGKVVPTMFPQTESSAAYGLPLERCMRVYAHMQDTGGFFITVLEKKAEFKARNENEAKTDSKEKSNGDVATSSAQTPNEETGENVVPKAEEEKTRVEETKPEEEAKIEEPRTEEPKAGEAKPADAPEESRDVIMDDASIASKRNLESGDDEPPAKKIKTTEDTEATPQAEPAPKGRRNGPIEEPFKFLDPEHPVIQNIREFYHLSPRFPTDRYMVRNAMGEPAKGIYYTTALMRDILTENEGRGLKLIHGGVRMFMKQEAPSAEVCRWRIQAEGMSILQGYVGQPRVVHLKNKETFHKLLIEMFPQISRDKWARFDEIGERVRDIGMGCCVLRIEPDGSDPEFTERMALPLWKSIHSLNLMLPKEDRSAMLLRLFNDSSPLINISLQKKNAQDEAAARSKEAAEADAEEERAAAIEDAPSEVAEEDVVVEEAPAAEEKAE